MKKEIFTKPILSCAIVFTICSLARIIEYFFIKTDETIFAENFLHKVFGIGVLAVMLIITKLSWDNIGFTKTKIIKNVFNGLALGTLCFSVAYLAECILLHCIYLSNFSCFLLSLE